MNIIIPLGGKGERFYNNGYVQPKPLISVFNKSIIEYVLDNLNIANNDKVFIIYNYKLDNYDFKNFINNKYPYINLIKIKDTNGAVETLYLGIEYILNNYIYSNKSLIIDCDTFYREDIVSIFRESLYNMVFYTINYERLPIYSYIELNNESNIMNIKEKEKISDNANTGAYAFADINVLYEYCKYVLDNGITFNNEPYTSCVISEMIKNNILFKGYKLDHNNVVSLGTPNEVEKYVTNINLLLFDLDGTLVNTDNIYIEVWNELLYKYNIKCTKEFFNYFIKGKSDASFLKYLNTEITDEEIIHISNMKDELFITKIQISKQDILLEGVITFLKKNKNNKIAIVTSCNKKSCNHILETTGLIKYVDLIIASEDCINHKPDPEPYIKAINFFKIDKDKIFIFEDSYSGYCSAKRSGVENICVINNKYSCNEICKLDEFKIYNYNNLDIENISKFKKNDVITSYLYEIKKKINTLPIKQIKQNDEYLKTGYICDIISYNIQYINGYNENIILKISNLDNELSDTAVKLNMYKNEQYFYNNISKLIKNTPKYLGSFTSNNKDAVILENLHKYDGKFNIDLNKNIHSLLGVVKNIFDIHSVFYFSSENEITPIFKSLRKINEILYYKQLIIRDFDNFLRNTSPLLNETDKNIFTYIFENIDKIYEAVSVFPLSFCHGDLKSPNIFYKNNCEPIFLDWQYIHLNKGISDIVFLVVESVDFDVITVEIVINYYYKLHNENVNISYSDFLKDFKNALCVFPFFVCVWFNSVDSDKLLDPIFPIRFLKNLVKYYRYFLSDLGNKNIQ
jgi:beta-phosphoglucomutase-like phosphatase (HAD superfamily)/dTDP-glucose pyrophosphorylase